MRIALIASVLVFASCKPVAQPPGLATVAAYEVPLLSERDRADFLKIFDSEARAEGLHVDATNSEELREAAAAMPAAAMTIHAEAWRGADDDQPEGGLSDMPDAPGLAWLTFPRGEDPALATRFRNRLMRRVFERWPNTLKLPIMPSGAIPLRDDLRRVPGGYTVDPQAAAKYAATRR